MKLHILLNRLFSGVIPHERLEIISHVDFMTIRERLQQLARERLPRMYFLYWPSMRDNTSQGQFEIKLTPVLKHWHWYFYNQFAPRVTVRLEERTDGTFVAIDLGADAYAELVTKVFIGGIAVGTIIVAGAAALYLVPVVALLIGGLPLSDGLPFLVAPFVGPALIVLLALWIQLAWNLDAVRSKRYVLDTLKPYDIVPQTGLVRP